MLITEDTFRYIRREWGENASKALWVDNRGIDFFKINLKGLYMILCEYVLDSNTNRNKDSLVLYYDIPLTYKDSAPMSRLYFKSEQDMMLFKLKYNI